MAGRFDSQSEPIETAPTRGRFDDQSDPVDQSIGDVAADAGLGFTGGFNETLGGILDLPQRAFLDVMTGTTEALTGEEVPIPEDMFMAGDVVRAFGTDKGSGGTASRIASRAGEEVAINAPFAAVPFAAAARGTKLAVDTGKQTLSRLGGTRLGREVQNVAGGFSPSGLRAGGNRLIEGISNAPLTAAAGELAATAGGGAGAGIAEEIAPGNKAAELGGFIAGAVAPTALTVTPTGLLIRGGRAVARRFSNDARTAAAREEVRTSLGGDLTPEQTAELTTSGQLREEIPGFDPSLAEATGSQSLVRTQQDLQNQPESPMAAFTRS